MVPRPRHSAPTGGAFQALDWPRDLEFTSDGLFLYVGSWGEDAVSALSRDPSTGLLGLVEAESEGQGGVSGMGAVWSLALSRDERHPYVAGGSGLATFARNPVTGSLAAHQDGQAGVDGLDGPTAVTVSPDGAHVYVSSYDDDAIAIFSRHPVTGALAFVDFVRNGSGGVIGLGDPNEIVVTPDGAHLYAAGSGGYVPRFASNASTGFLTFLGAVQNGAGGVHGLGVPSGIASDRRGRFIAVSNAVADSIALFTRDPGSGALYFARVECDGVGGVDGLDFATSPSFSPSGRHLLATGRMNDDALALFAPEPRGPIGALTALAAVLWTSRLGRTTSGAWPR